MEARRGTGQACVIIDEARLCCLASAPPLQADLFQEASSNPHHHLNHQSPHRPHASPTHHVSLLRHQRQSSMPSRLAPPACKTASAPRRQKGISADTDLALRLVSIGLWHRCHLNPDQARPGGFAPSLPRSSITAELTFAPPRSPLFQFFSVRRRPSRRFQSPPPLL